MLFFFSRQAVYLPNQERPHFHTHTTTTNMASLSEAAAAGSTRMVKGLLDNGADLNRPGSDGLFPLCVAAFWGHVPLVEVWFALCISVSRECVCVFFFFLFFFVFLFFCFLFVFLVLFFGFVFVFAFLVVFCLVLLLDSELLSFNFLLGIQFMLQHGADVNAQNPSNKWTALHAAAIQGECPTVCLKIVCLCVIV